MSALPAAAALEVRPAVGDDVGALTGLYEAACAELAGMRGGRALLGLSGRPVPAGKSFLQQLDDPGRALVVGLLERRVVGYGSCTTRDLHAAGRATGAPTGPSDGAPPERLGSIEELYVLSEARRCGVGRAISAALVDWCRERGCTGVDASALPGSRAVKSFFESESFTARLLVMHRHLR